MRPVLLRTDALLIGSYPCMVLLAALLAVGTAALRSTRRDVRVHVLVRTLIIATLGGWIAGRLLPPLVAGEPGGVQWGRLVPGGQAGQSLSWFLVVAFPLAVLSLASQRGKVMTYLDVLAPSVLFGLAVVKVGCLLGGCCGGRICPPRWGIQYPYASDMYVLQWHARLIAPPAALVRTDSTGTARLLGGAQWLEAHRHSPPTALAEHARNHGLSYAGLLDMIAAERSRPVWPVPVWYIVASGALWIAAEIGFRRMRQGGWTTGFVLVAYAAMRLTFDGYVAGVERAVLNLTQSQLVAVASAIIGVGIWISCRRSRAATVPT